MRHFLVYFLLAASISVSKIGSGASLPIDLQNEVTLNKKHDKLFKSSSKDDEGRIIRLILQLEALKLVKGDSNPPSKRFLSPWKPVDDFSLIPDGLFEVMLNGGLLSSKFQKGMIKWLRKDYQIQDSEFAKFTSQTQQRICHNGRCWDLGDIGSECCPF